MQNSYKFYLGMSIVCFALFFLFFGLGRNQTQSIQHQQEQALIQKNHSDSLKLDQLTKNQQILLLKIDSLKNNSVVTTIDTIPKPKVVLPSEKATKQTPVLPRKIDSIKPDSVPPKIP